MHNLFKCIFHKHLKTLYITISCLNYFQNSILMFFIPSVTRDMASLAMIYMPVVIFVFLGSRFCWTVLLKYRCTTQCGK